MNEDLFPSPTDDELHERYEKRSEEQRKIVKTCSHLWNFVTFISRMSKMDFEGRQCCRCKVVIEMSEDVHRSLSRSE